jgi:hypothetical protein
MSAVGRLEPIERDVSSFVTAPAPPQFGFDAEAFVALESVGV